MDKNPAPASSSPTDWDALQQHLGASFLQSSNWQRFQEALGYRTFTVHGKGWSCLLVARKSRFGPYLLAPYGPTLSQPTAVKDALPQLVELAKQEGAWWLRLEPCLPLDRETDLAAALPASGVKTVVAPKQVNPLFTRVVDLSPSEEDILMSFSQTNRNLLRREMKNKVLSYRVSHDPADIEVYLNMMHLVSKRNKVSFHSDNYFRTQAQTLMPGGDMWMQIALKDNKPVACLIMHKFNHTATYTYAASEPEARKLNAAGLLLWQALMTAKQAGVTKVDLFGVAPEDAGPDHPWHGFSSFKQQFGGHVVRRGQTIDIPFKQPRYKLYRAASKVRKSL